MSYAQVINIIELANFVLGIALCAFLLYCLIFRTRQDLGIYRYLQIIMVSIDASYTTGQLFIRGRIITAEGMFAMIPTSSFGVTKEVLCLYLAVYNLTWVMIDYNFLYRLWAVKSPLRIGLFSDARFILLLISIGLLESAVWFASVYYLFTPTTSGRLTMREETLKEYGIDTTSHVMIMGDYFLEDGSMHWRPVEGVIVSFVVMTICFGFMIYSIVEILHHLRVSKFISKKTMRLQQQLFIALCLQAIIPLIFLYCPCGMMILLPLTRLDSSWMARATPLLISCFLPLDALAVLLSMTEYRQELMRIIRCECDSSLHHTVSLGSRERRSSTVIHSKVP